MKSPSDSAVSARRIVRRRLAEPGYDPPIELEELLSSPPTLHVAPNGRPSSLAIGEQVLRVIDANIGPESRTLETGAGLSTLLFALKGSDHTCVVPSGGEIERIKAWCRENGISTERVTFHEERSEEVLPRLPCDPLDLVLIDGGHGFPSPFIDWYYAGRRLCGGGILIVDDTQLWTGRVLKGFLESEPEWQLVENFALRSAVFRRESVGGPLADWGHQPYVARRSFNSRSGRAVRRGVRAFDLLRRGDLPQVARRLRAGG